MACIRVQWEMFYSAGIKLTETIRKVSVFVSDTEEK